MATVRRMRNRREKLGLTIIECAKRVGVSRLTWAYWERGVQTPKPDHISRVEALLGRRWSWLNAEIPY